MDKTTKLLKKENLTDAINALLPSYEVFAPVGEGERLAFTKIGAESSGKINLSGLPAVSPKDLLFPRSETLYGISLDTGETYQQEEALPTAIFGIRPCDARGIVNLDRVFIDEAYTDSAYADRREKLTIVTAACGVVQSPACFCDSMGGGPDSEEGSDAILTETDDGSVFLVSFLTEKGDEIGKIWESAGLISSPGKAKAAAPPSCELKVTKPADLPEKLKAAFEDPAWGRFSEACIGCGACSFICPTCYCFDIDSETHGGIAEQLRCWDCCVFSDYSRMAGGHNPRPTKKERLRQRYLHKLSWFDERYGRTLCVGCGRCIMKCPAGLDIASIIEWGGTL